MSRQKELWPYRKNFDARRTALVDFRHTPACLRLYRVIRDRLDYDGLLTDGTLNLEWLYLEHGWPFYRLRKGRRLIGIVNVVHLNRLPGIQRRLAAYLLAYGFRPAEYRVKRARIRLNADKRGLPGLFDKATA